MTSYQRTPISPFPPQHEHPHNPHNSQNGNGDYSLTEALSLNFKDGPSLNIHDLGLDLNLPPSSPPKLPLPAVPQKDNHRSTSNYTQSKPPSQTPSHNTLKRSPTKNHSLPPRTDSRPKSSPSPNSKQGEDQAKKRSEKKVTMAPSATTSKAQRSCLELCHKTTHSIDLIAVHILEYLTTAKHSVPGFDALAHDFLSTCEILYSLQSGLETFSSNGPEHKNLPSELLSELETKFRVTQADFNMLNSMLGKMNAPKKGLSKLGRIFGGEGEGEVRKISAALKRTRESLKMSSLVFQWSLAGAGEKGIVEKERGFGYTGLAAALDRLEEAPTKEKELPQAAAASSPPPPQQQQQQTLSHVPAFPAPPPQQQQPQANFPFGEINTQLQTPVQQHRELHQPQAPWSHRASSIPHDGTNSIGRTSGNDFLGSQTQSYRGGSNAPDFHQNNAAMAHLTNSTVSTTDPFLHYDRQSALDDTRSMTSHTDPSLFHEELAALDLDTSKVIRHLVDPSSMPRLYPPLSAEGETPNMKGALISAIRGKNHRLVEQLLHRGVSTAAAPNMHPLKEAILAHDEESVRLLLLLGADPNEAGRDGVTPLLASVEKSFLAGATTLLKYGADANFPAGLEPESPLAVAVMNNMVGISQVLLQYGGDANLATTEGTPILTAAIRKKTPKKFIDLLITYGANVNAKSREGKTALFEALSVGRADITTSLLDSGANPNLPGPKHMLWPAIHHPQCLQVLLTHGADPKKAPGIMEQAVGINNIETVKILLKAGVSPDIKKDGIFTPLCSAIRDDRAELLKLLLSNGADPNVPAAEYPAFKCVTHNRVHFLPLLVASGAKLDTPKGIIETAVSVNNVEALNWLLDQGVSPNDRSPKGMSALTTAIRENRVEMLDLLLLRGADPHVRGEDWPICMAVRNPPMLQKILSVISEPQAFKGIVEMAVHANQLESIKLLLAAGVSVEDKNGGVFSPLTTAIREDHKELVSYLIDEAGADVNAPGEHLPIVKALRRYHGENDTEIMELLLERGADPNKLYRGWNGIMQAVENGDADILRLLARKAGVDLEVRDELGRTVVEMAASRGWDEAVQILIEGDVGLRMKH